jgi:enamine deaminase RidA (YjgF/YER057c/UK114 family)
MELVTHKKVKSDRLMPWGKGTVVIGAKGFVYLSGNTATADEYDPTSKTGGGAVGDAAAQWRAILANIKSDLEELGSALEYLIRDLLYQGAISQWRRSELSQFSPRCVGRVLC